MTITAINSGDASQAQMWDSNTVPGPDDDVVIPDGLSDIVYVSQNLTFKTLTVNDPVKITNGVVLTVLGLVSVVNTGSIRAAGIAKLLYGSLQISGDSSTIGSDDESTLKVQSIHGQVAFTGTFAGTVNE